MSEVIDQILSSRLGNWLDVGGWEAKEGCYCSSLHGRLYSVFGYILKFGYLAFQTGLVPY